MFAVQLSVSSDVNKEKIIYNLVSSYWRYDLPTLQSIARDLPEAQVYGAVYQVGYITRMHNHR